MSMSKAASKAADGLKTAALSVTALTAGTLLLVNQTTSYAKELKIASQLSGVAIEEIQGMAFAASTVGIGLEKLGDISKDTLERIGDYLNTGGGEFQTFADAMNLTKEEARALAVEFSTLSGPQVLQEMVNRMEDAGLSSVQMANALESMASDTTNLIPLLLDAGKGMSDLAKNSREFTVPLTDADLKKLADLDEALKLAASSAKSLADRTLVDLSGWFERAAEAASFFFASLNEGTISAKQVRLLEIQEDMESLNKSIENNQSVTGRLKNALLGDGTNAFADKKSREEINELLAEQAQIMMDIQSLRNKPTEDPDKKTPEINDNLKVLPDTDNTKKIQAIADSFKIEEDLLAEKLARDLEVIGEDKILRYALEEKYWMDIVELEQKGEDEKNKIAQDSAKKKISIDQKRQNTEQSLEKKNVQSLMSIASSVLGQSEGIGKALFLGSQALALSETFVNTQAASIKALTIDPTGILSAKVQASGNISMAAIAATTLGSLSSSSGGGPTGGGGSFSSSGGGAITPRNEQGNFQEETSSLSLTDSSASGSQAINITVPDGDEIGQAIANWLSKATAEGRA